MRDIALDEITLRKYEMPKTKEIRDIIKKFCMSLGLLQEGDSRDIVVDILLVLIKYGKEKKMLSSEEIKREVEKIRKINNREMKGVSESNIRRQLKRLREVYLVEKIKNRYRISEFDNFKNLLDKIINVKINVILERIKKYAEEIDELLK